MERRAQKESARENYMRKNTMDQNMENNNMKKRNMKKTTAKALVITGAICLATIGGVSAFLTDYDKATNQFTVGKVDIDLDEPGWKPEDHTKLEPGEVISKDPQITNTGTNDAFTYLEVSVPMKEVTAALEYGTRQPTKLQELFSFTAKDSWTRLDSKKVGDSQVYVYTYNKILKANETTETLFDTVKFLNITEGPLDGVELEIPVRAYAIQTTGTGGSGSILDQARAAYEKYVNQNKGSEGKATA